MAVNAHAKSRLDGWWGWRQPLENAGAARQADAESAREYVQLQPKPAGDDGAGHPMSAPPDDAVDAGAVASPPPPPPPDDVGAAEAVAPPPAAPPKMVGPELRLHCLQVLWGPCEMWPGGKEKHDAIARVAALEPDDLVVEIGCGLGGFAQAMARDYGARVLAADTDPLDAKVAGELIDGQPFADRVRFAPVDLSPLSLSAADARLVIARNALGRTTDLAGLIARLAGMAADGGAIMFTNLFRETADAVPSVVLKELGPAHLAEVEAAIHAAGLELVAVRDVNDALNESVVEGWSRLNAQITKGNLPAPVLKVMQAEAERWAEITGAIARKQMSAKWIVARKPSTSAPTQRPGMLARAKSVILGRLFRRRVA